MIAPLVITGILGLLILSHLWENYQQRALQDVDIQVLDDNILTYHLDWNVLQSEEFKLIHYVKKVNATRRYAELTGVTREQAWHAIDDISLHSKRKLRAIEDVLDDERNVLRRLIQSGDLDNAVAQLAKNLDVDQFTAQEALTYIQHELKHGEQV